MYFFAHFACSNFVDNITPSCLYTSSTIKLSNIATISHITHSMAIWVAMTLLKLGLLTTIDPSDSTYFSFFPPFPLSLPKPCSSLPQDMKSNQAQLGDIGSERTRPSKPHKYTTMFSQQKGFNVISVVWPRNRHCSTTQHYLIFEFHVGMSKWTSVCVCRPGFNFPPE